MNEENVKFSANGDAPVLPTADGGHLSDEEIIAYQYGTLPSPEAEQRAQNHLVECRRCANALLELSEFAHDEPAAVFTNDENLDARWTQFNARYAAELPFAEKKKLPEKSIAAEPPAARKKFFGFLSFNYAALGFAALIVFFTGALFFALRNSPNEQANVAANVRPTVQPSATAAPSVAENQNGARQNDSVNAVAPNQSNDQNSSKNQNPNRAVPTPTPKSRPEELPSAPPVELALNTIDVELYPNEQVRDGVGADTPIVRRPANARRIRLRLNAPAAPAALSNFSVEIADAQNKTILTQPIRPNRRGGFALFVPAKALTPGTYSIKIYGKENQARKLFTAYDFIVENE